MWFAVKNLHNFDKKASIMPGGRDFRMLMNGSPASVSGSAGEVLAAKSLRDKSKKAYTTADYRALLSKAKGKKEDGKKRFAKMKGLKVKTQKERGRRRRQSLFSPTPPMRAVYSLHGTRCPVLNARLKCCRLPRGVWAATASFLLHLFFFVRCGTQHLLFILAVSFLSWFYFVL